MHIYNYGGVYGLYVVVDGFFIISGYLLYKNIDRYASRFTSPWAYTMYKYSQLYGKYIISFIFSFVVICYANSIKGIEILNKLLDSAPEILLLQAIGLNREWDYINPTTWYISVIFIAGFVMFYLLTKHRKAFMHFIAPLCLIAGYAYLYRTLGNIDAVTKTFGAFGNTVLIRGFCDMCLGMYAVHITKFFQETKIKVWILKLVANVLLLCTLVCAMFLGHGLNDFAFLLVMVFVIALGFIPRKRVAIDGFIEKFSSLTLSIYLMHEIFRTYLMKMIFGDPVGLKEEIIYTIIYLALVIVSAILLDISGGALQKLFKKVRSNEK